MTEEIAHHAWSIDPAQYERHEERRGRRHGFEHISGAHTALVVVDMVAFFTDANPYTRGIVGNINLLASALRSAGATVAWVVPSDVTPSPARIEFLGPNVAELYQRSGGEGSPRARLASTLEPTDGDCFVEKSAPSAFFPGACSLHDELVSREIDTVLVVGTVANVCVESTIRDASTLGYRTVLVADAVSAQNDADLNATLHTVYRSFADVRPTAEIVDLLLGGAP